MIYWKTHIWFYYGWYEPLQPELLWQIGQPTIKNQNYWYRIVFLMIVKIKCRNLTKTTPWTPANQRLCENPPNLPVLKLLSPETQRIINPASARRSPEWILINSGGPQIHSASSGRRRKRQFSIWKKTDPRIQQNHGFQTGNFPRIPEGCWDPISICCTGHHELEIYKF